MALSGDVLLIGLTPAQIEQAAAGLAPSRAQPSTVDRALDELDRDRYALLIIDAKSGLDGLMLLQHVRTSPRLRVMPVLYLMDRRTEGAVTITEFIRGLGIERVPYSDDLQRVVAAARPGLGRTVPSVEGSNGDESDGVPRQPESMQPQTEADAEAPGEPHWEAAADHEARDESGGEAEALSGSPDMVPSRPPGAEDAASMEPAAEHAAAVEDGEEGISERLKE